MQPQSSGRIEDQQKLQPIGYLAADVDQNRMQTVKNIPHIFLTWSKYKLMCHFGYQYIGEHSEKQLNHSHGSINVRGCGMLLPAIAARKALQRPPVRDGAAACQQLQ